MTVEMPVVLVPGRTFWNPPLSRPLERWRTRHIRRAVQKAQRERDELPPEMRRLAKQLDAEFERAVLYGTRTQRDDS